MSMNCDICKKGIDPNSEFDAMISSERALVSFHVRCVASLTCNKCGKPIPDLRDWVHLSYTDFPKPDEHYHSLCYYDMTGDDIIVELDNRIDNNEL